MNAAPRIAAAAAAAPVIADDADDNIKFNTLPDDVLNLVWTFLDNPASLARVNKRFLALSKDTFWRAKWLIQRYVIYEVMFEAIARPKLFTPALFHQLLRLKVPLTVNVIQLVHLQLNPTARAYVENGADIRWGHISFAAYSAIINRAVEVYGDKISFEPQHYHSYVFRGWLMEQDYDARDDLADPEPCEAVRKLFRTTRFMPLKVALEESDGMECGMEMCRREEEDDVLTALVLDASLLPFVVRNGYVLTTERVEELIRRWHDEFQDPKSVLQFVKILQNVSPGHIINISQAYAQEVFDEADNLRVVEPFQIRGPYTIWRNTAERDNTIALGRRNVLVAIDKANSLPFRLCKVIKQLQPRAPAAASSKSNTSGKRARDEAGDDEAVEVGAKESSIISKKARRSRRS